MRFTGGCEEQGGTSGLGFGREGGEIDGIGLEASLGQAAAQPIHFEAGPALVHHSAEIVAVVLEQIDDGQFAAGVEDAGGFPEGDAGLIDVSEDENEQGGVATARVNGERFDGGAMQLDVFAVAKALARL